MAPPTTIPDEALAGYEGWSSKLAWGGEWTNTWKLEDAEGNMRFIKVGWTGRYPSLGEERDRMLWCARHITVPEVVDFGTDGTCEWTITSPLPGVDATIEKLSMPPERLVPMLGAALRRWHETLPVAECPFDFTIDRAIEVLAPRVDASTQDAFDALLRDRPDREDLVVCHGDYCFPNVFIEHEAVCGFLDLGMLGVADRWWDIAIGAWSVTWNVDPSYEPLFYEGYGVESDEARISYYRALYRLVG